MFFVSASLVSGGRDSPPLPPIVCLTTSHVLFVFLSFASLLLTTLFSFRFSLHAMPSAADNDDQLLPTSSDSDSGDEQRQEDSDVEQEEDTFTTSVFGVELMFPCFAFDKAVSASPPKEGATYEDISKALLEMLDVADTTKYLVYLHWFTVIHDTFADDAAGLAAKEEELVALACERETLGKAPTKLAHRMLVAHYISVTDVKVDDLLRKKKVSLSMVAAVAVDVVRSEFLLGRFFWLIGRGALDQFEGTTSDRLKELGKKVVANYTIQGWKWDSSGLHVSILEFSANVEATMEQVLNWGPTFHKATNPFLVDHAYWGPLIEEERERVMKLKVTEMQLRARTKSLWDVTFSDRTTLKMSEAAIVGSGQKHWVEALRRAQVDAESKEAKAADGKEESKAVESKEEPKEDSPEVLRLKQELEAERERRNREMEEHKRDLEKYSKQQAEQVKANGIVQQLQEEVKQLRQQLAQREEQRKKVSPLKALLRKRKWTEEETALIDQLVFKRVKQKAPDESRRKSIVQELDLCAAEDGKEQETDEDEEAEEERTEEPVEERNEEHTEEQVEEPAPTPRTRGRGKK